MSNSITASLIAIQVSSTFNRGRGHGSHFLYYTDTSTTTGSFPSKTSWIPRGRWATTSTTKNLQLATVEADYQRKCANSAFTKTHITPQMCSPTPPAVQCLLYTIIFQFQAFDMSPPLSVALPVLYTPTMFIIST